MAGGAALGVLGSTALHRHPILLLPPPPLTLAQLQRRLDGSPRLAKRVDAAVKERHAGIHVGDAPRRRRRLLTAAAVSRHLRS